MQHDHRHTPLEEAGEASELRTPAVRRAIWTSTAVNLGLSLSKVWVGLIAHSAALVADGVHSLSDLVVDFIALAVSGESQKDADQEHPYGHQRFETAASLAVGALLIGVGISMLYSSISQLQSPANIPPVEVIALWVALIGLVTKEMLFRYMLRIAKRVKSSFVVTNAWHARSDAAASLMVAVGIVGNLAGYRMLDAIAALVVGLIIAKMGWTFAWNALNELMDGSADGAEVEAIRQTLLNTPGVCGVHDLRTRKMGDLIAVDAHLEVDADITVEAGHEIAVEARVRVLKRHRVLDLMTHLDPFRRPDLDHEVAPRR